MESLLRSEVSCVDCRDSHYESGKDPPCEAFSKHPATQEYGHWCKYGLVELHPDHIPVLDCWRFLRAFGPEAGMAILLVRYTDEQLRAMADDLQLVQGVTNRVENEKAKPRKERD